MNRRVDFGDDRSDEEVVRDLNHLLADEDMAPAIGLANGLMLSFALWTAVAVVWWFS